MAMPLSPVPLDRGTARLADWGTVELSGATSAVLRLASAADVGLPASVAADLTGGVLLLNDDEGRLLFLPYAGHEVVAYDLKEGELLYPVVSLPRHQEQGLRMAVVRLIPNLGVMHLTEATLTLYWDDCTVAWRQDDDFGGWSIEGIGLDEAHLVTGDWSGNEQRQRRSLADGTRRER
jgi:hypothetical protein